MKLSMLQKQFRRYPMNKWHYTCNDKIFNDKFSAIKENTYSNKPIGFHEPTCYDEFDFSIEPKESWLELCKNQAQKIRDNYDYIRLWYSGGCDSRTALDSFLLNGIHIDEIICTRCGIGEADEEIDKFAIPYLNKITDLIPNTKINIVTATEKQYEQFYNNKHWYEDLTHDTGINTGYHFRLNHMLDNFDLYVQQGKTGNVIGKDKPFLIYVEGKWYTYFLDLFLENQLGKSSDTVNFFLDDPKVHAKQCHTLLTAIKKYIPPQNYNDVAGGYTTYQDFWNRHSGRFESNAIFPPKKLNLKMSDGDIELDKRKLLYHNNKEKVALETIMTSRPDLIKKWQSGLDEFSKLANGKWFNNGRPEFGTVGVFANFHGLDIKSHKSVDELFPNGFKT